LREEIAEQAAEKLVISILIKFEKVDVLKIHLELLEEALAEFSDRC
jgi:hypothetical protein